MLWLDMDMYVLAEEDAFVIEANKLPTNEETNQNSRSRSAKLRIFEKS